MDATKLPTQVTSGKVMDNYCLPAGYRSRPANNQGLRVTDGAQKRIYCYAAQIAARDPGVRSVLDWGCGSGYKLVKHFGPYDTLGVDVDYRLDTLHARYPERQWAIAPVEITADLVLCVDVIEHLDEPLSLLRRFAAGRWRHLVISTPERHLVARHKARTKGQRQRQISGPPLNHWHTREWTSDEFRQLLVRELDLVPELCVLGRYNLVAHFERK